jgi:hypothetical protein
MYELTTTSFMKDSKQNLFTGQSLTKEEQYGTDFNHMFTFNGRLLSESSHVIVPKKNNQRILRCFNTNSL